jgi:hypothetical protein
MQAESLTYFLYSRNNFIFDDGDRLAASVSDIYVTEHIYSILLHGFYAEEIRYVAGTTSRVTALHGVALYCMDGSIILCILA